ncbi:MFS transporter [Labilibaculum sp.]|uniref:MFS transporter n=1 Tax=Labilibaculum sp. TaxID=2060723 RepID=UPI003564DA96
MNKISNFGIFTLLFVSSLTIMVGTVIAPSLSGIVKTINFGFSPSWLITVPALGVVLFAPLIGRLLNKLGSIKLLCFGLVSYGILGLLGAFISNDYLLILDRFLLGAATVTIQVSVTTYIVEIFTNETRLKMIAWQGMAIEMGGVIFLAMGGILGQMHWQYPFYIYLSAIICVFLVFNTLPKSQAKKQEQKVLSTSNPKNHSRIRIIFCASLLAMMLFFVGIVTLPLYLPDCFTFNESETGYLLAFISLTAILTASQMPKMIRFLGDGKTLSLGFAFYMLAYLVLSSTASIPFLLLSALFLGIGFGLSIPLLNHMMIEASNSENQGKNLGLYSMGIFGGQFLSTFVQSISGNYIAVYSFSAVLAFVVGGVIFYNFQNSLKVQLE